MKTFAADLHIHTALSPCGCDEMTPPAIVERAVAAGLAIIAVCDHNCARNAQAVQEAAGERLCVLAGIELMTSEDIHLLGIFPDANAAMTVSEMISQSLPKVGKRYCGEFGQQSILDASGKIIGSESKMLAAPSVFSLNEAVSIIKKQNGISIAAHINRPSLSVLSQLGIFPANAGFDAIEIFTSPLIKIDWQKYAAFGLPIITSSDSHYLADIGNYPTKLKMESPSFEELVMVLKGTGGREIEKINI